LNYRHAYHAGNFADVFKHLFLVRILEHLSIKPAPFRVIDTHAGIGRYALDSEEARKTGEAEKGIRQFARLDRQDEAAKLAASYLSLVETYQEAGFYPGSPALSAALMRAQDRMTCAELHPRDGLKLKRHLGRDQRIAILERDGYQVLKAGTPPKEKRGLVLIDPPFEAPDEFERVFGAVTGAYAKWPTGIYAIWYPIKADGLSDRFLEVMQKTGIAKQLSLELLIAPRQAPKGLPGCGMLIINPPFGLDEQATHVLPLMQKMMDQGGGSTRCHWLVAENASHSG
jgi:23S rRNA (adenine2030-N6)-methyltransferase